MPFLKRLFFLSILAILAPVAHARSSRPNVVFILTDDMGYGDLGSYGATDISTPNLDRMAREGVRLTDNYAAAPVCTPTRVAFLTGRYQQRVGVDWAIWPYGEGLPASETSVASMLKRNGYATALSGKWHAGVAGPNAHGFDEFFGILGANADFFTHRSVVPEGGPGLFENTEPIEREGYLTDLISQRSVDFIQRHADRPFFLFVSYNAPHWPFQPPDRSWWAGYDNRVQGTRQDYIGMIESIDAGVGRILETLATHGLAENTLVIFTNDNGGERLSRSTPLFHGKGTLWEGGIRVPGLIWWPGQVPAGKTSRQAAITMDMTATILAATGTLPPEGRPLDGIDLLPILKGEKPLQERTFFWRMDQKGIVQRAVRRGRWKYVFDGIEQHEMLFDMENDPGERHTLFYEHPQLVTELRHSLSRWEQEVDGCPCGEN